MSEKREKIKSNSSLNRRKIFTFRLREDVVKKLRELALEKHGSLYGSISVELECAINLWYSLHKDPSTARQLLESIVKEHTNTQGVITLNKVLNKVNPPQRVWEVYQQVKMVIKEIEGTSYIPHQTTKINLMKAIEKVRGSDPRTIKKWLRLFEKWKLIKWISPHTVELV